MGRRVTCDRPTRRYTLAPAPPLVCLCHHTEADPGRNFGECPACRRKPMALIQASVSHP